MAAHPPANPRLAPARAGRFPRLVAALVALALCLAAPVRPAFAEFEDKHPGVRASAMGGAHVAVSGDSESVFYNPAGIHERTEVSELSSMHTTLYGQKDMAYDYVAFLQPMMPFAVVALAVQSFGGELYKEEVTSLTLSRRVAEKAALGVNLKSLRTRISDTPDAASFSGDIGAILKYDPRFQAGFAILDFNNPRVNDVLPRTAKVGVAFRPVDSLLLALDYSKRRDESDGAFMLGEEYRVNDQFCIRAGYITRPARVTAGFGLHLGPLRVNYAWRNHEELDDTHRVSMALTF